MKFDIPRIKSRLTAKVSELEFNTLHNYRIDDTYTLILDKDFIVIEDNKKNVLKYTQIDNIHVMSYKSETTQLNSEYNETTQKSTLNINKINFEELNEIETPANIYSLFKIIKDFENINKKLSNNQLYTIKEILDNINEKKKTYTLRYDSVDYKLKDIFEPIQKLKETSDDKELFIKSISYSEKKDFKVISISFDGIIYMNKKFNKKTKLEQYTYSNYFIENNLKNILIPQDIEDFEKNKIKMEQIFLKISLENLSYNNYKEQIEFFLDSNIEVKRKPKL